jgi:hypothetical protein
VSHDLQRDTRSPVWMLQDAMATLPQVELDTEHYFADGMYLRSLPRPAGTLIVGKVHKKEHFYMVLAGAVTVTDGDAPAITLRAPAIVVSQPGTKRAVYALEDSVCCTVHRTDSRDLDAIEADLVEADPTALFDCRNQLVSAILGRTL